ncbi:hypothetical protein [Yersinia phage vB_YenM_P778]
MRDEEIGKPMERKFVKQFGGKLINNLTLQYLDIDALRDDVTWSIKDQTRASKISGNLSFELELIDERSGEIMAGNYAACRADKYAIACHWCNDDYWFIADVSTVKDFVGLGEKDWTKKGLTAYTRSDNVGRKFTQATNILVPIKALITAKIGHIKKVKCYVRA